VQCPRGGNWAVAAVPAVRTVGRRSFRTAVAVLGIESRGAASSAVCA